MTRAAKKEKVLTTEEKLQQALVPVEEQPYKVPENWCWVKLGNASEIIMGQSPEGSATTDDPSYMPLIGGAADMGDLYPKATRYTTVPTKIGKKDDVILCIRATLGRPIYSDREYCLGRGVAAVRSEILIKEYLRYGLLSFEQYLYDRATGTTFAQVSSATLQKMPFPIPPLAEQRRIASRIESLFAKLDEAKEKAQSVVDGFEDRKAAILHKAFTGELTAEWRKKKEIPYSSWINMKWDDFIVNIEAGKNWNAEGRPPKNDEFGVVKVSAVTWGEFDEFESKTCTLSEQWNVNTQIHEGDFLFSRANTLQLVGNCVIVKAISKRLMLSDKILRLSFDSSVCPQYVLYFTRSRLYRNQIEELASGNQDGMRNVSQKNMRLVSFPIPSMNEQKEIVSILNSLLSGEQQAKEIAEQVISNANTMKRSILAHAFRGELGTNDPTDESAEELLERVL